MVGSDALPRKKGSKKESKEEDDVDQLKAGEDSEEKKAQDKNRRRMVVESIVEGRKMEAYAEHRTKEMHVCWLCETICYRKKPMKNIGKKWICIDCLKQLKEVLETIGQWEEELALENEMKMQLDGGLGI